MSVQFAALIALTWVMWWLGYCTARNRYDQERSMPYKYICREHGMTFRSDNPNVVASMLEQHQRDHH